MSYTLLRAGGSGIVLLGEHALRLGCAPSALEALDLAPGVFAVWHEGGRLRAEARGGTRLEEGMPVRFLPTPLQGGPVEKPEPPGPFAPLRLPGMVTLLTDAAGHELLEADSAALIGWRDGDLICVPGDRPRVRSTAERALRSRLAIREAPLLVDGAEPLLLVNAVKGACAVSIPGRPPFPVEARAAIEAALTP